MGIERIDDGGGIITDGDILYHVAFCLDCWGSVGQEAIIVPGLSLEAPKFEQSDYICFASHSSINNGDKMVSACTNAEYHSGKYPLQIVGGDWIWMLCMNCASDVDFTEVQIQQR